MSHRKVACVFFCLERKWGVQIAEMIFQTRSRTLRVCGAKYNQKWIRILHQDIKSIFHIGHNLSFVKFHSVLFLQSAIFSWFIFLASVTGLWLGDFPFKIFIFGNLIGFQFIHPNYPFFQKIIQKFPMVTNSLQNISTHLLTVLTTCVILHAEQRKQHISPVGEIFLI